MLTGKQKLGVIKRKQAILKKSKYYDSVASVWTEKDVITWQITEDNKLNYVEVF